MTIARTRDASELISISTEKVEKIRGLFLNYVASFHKRNDEIYNQHIDVKKIHTIHVSNEISGIGNSLDFTKEQLAFAEIIACSTISDVLSNFKLYYHFCRCRIGEPC
jgi:hypothetical protein